MAIGTTSRRVNLADGSNAARIDQLRRLHVRDPDLQVLVDLHVEQLRQLTKIALLLSHMTGVAVRDEDIDLPSL